jgi:hypothetical protein
LINELLPELSPRTLNNEPAQLSVSQLAVALNCNILYIYKHQRSRVDPIPVAGYIRNRPQFDPQQVSDWIKAGQLNSGHASVTSGSVAVRG